MVVLVFEKSFFRGRSSNAAVAQSVECVLGKDEVMGSSPISSFGCVDVRLRLVWVAVCVFLERFVGC